MGKVDNNTLRKGSSLDVTDKLLSDEQAAGDYNAGKSMGSGNAAGGALHFGMGTARWEPPAQPFPAVNNSRLAARTNRFWRSE